MILNKDFYKRVGAITKGNGLQIFMAIVVIMAITQAILTLGRDASSYRALTSYMELVFESRVEFDPIYFNELVSNASGTNGINIFTIISTIVSTLLYLGLDANVLFLMEDKKFNIFDIYKVIEKNFIKYLVIAIVYSALIYALGFIPLVGFVVIIIVQYGFAFYPYLLVKEDTEYIDYFKNSWDLTSGHKFNLFKIDLHYFMRMVAPTLIAMLIFFISVVADVEALILFSLFILLVGVVVSLYFIFRYAAQVRVAKALYFTEVYSNEFEKEII